MNIVAFFVLHGAERKDLNVRGAMLHVVGDLLGSAAAMVAALVILWTGWTPIDPLLSVLVALLILRSAWFLVRESGHILLEGAPAHLDIARSDADLEAAVPGVEDVHHVHAWSLTQDKPMLTLHARIADLSDSERVTLAIRARLRERFGVDHATVEIECVTCADGAGRKATPGKRRAGDLPCQTGPGEQQRRGQQERCTGQVQRRVGVMAQANMKPNRVGPIRLATAIRLALAPCSWPCSSR